MKHKSIKLREKVGTLLLIHIHHLPNDRLLEVIAGRNDSDPNSGRAKATPVFVFIVFGTDTGTRNRFNHSFNGSNPVC